MAGPMMAGVLTESFGFPITTTILAGCCLVVMLVVSLFGVWEYRCGKGLVHHGKSQFVQYAVQFWLLV